MADWVAQGTRALAGPTDRLNPPFRAVATGVLAPYRRSESLAAMTDIGTPACFIAKPSLPAVKYRQVGK